MYDIVFSTNQVIADSAHEAMANALLLLKGHTLGIAGVARQTHMEEWRGILSMRDYEVTVG